DRLLQRVLPENIHIELKYDAGIYMVNADPTRLQQVFMNLALNARDAMPDGGDLIFELGWLALNPDDRPPIPELTPGKWITLAVTDTGDGISPEVLPHVFEPFFTTKPVGQGTGLGLAQVYGIIKQHNGLIDVCSQLGQGTTFSIYLPALPGSTLEDDQAESSAQFDGAGLTILLVEDDQSTREAIQALLCSQNYRVLTASNGAEAYEIYIRAAGSISLVVSDVVMPEMGGVALYRSLQERWPQVKMLFITGHPMETSSHAMMEKTNIRWLQKPFSVVEFNRSVQQMVRGKA
ncbi:MAG: response regulator, partial [Chloroflexota bacterium]